MGIVNPDQKPDGGEEETPAPPTAIPPTNEERVEERVEGPQHVPPLYELIEGGKVLTLNMPAGIEPGAGSRAVGVMLKNAWLQALLMRPAKIKEKPSVPTSGPPSLSVTNIKPSLRWARTIHRAMKSLLR